MREHVVRQPDGRELAVQEDGDPTGRPVFSFHGTPGSRLLYPPHVADARARGIRLIGYDRPGYGGSTPRRGRRMADVATDVGAIADSLGIERFGIWGHSGGGAPALACAALLPGRVVAASSLAGVAPLNGTGFDPLAGMGAANLEDFRLMMSDRAAWEAKTESDARELAHAGPDEMRQMLDSLLSDVDRPVLTPELLDFFQTQGGEGLRNGAAGMRDDNLSDVEPWGFELATIRGPVQVWHGTHDRFVPFTHGQWLATHVPHAEAHLEPEEGHLTLYRGRIPEVHAWILSKF